MNEQLGNISEMREKVQFDNGAQFWVYISPFNDTARYVTEWKIRFEQEDGSWSGTITPDNPQETLQTPGLSGVFKVTVTAGLGDKPIEIRI